MFTLAVNESSRFNKIVVLVVHPASYRRLSVFHKQRGKFDHLVYIVVDIIYRALQNVELANIVAIVAAIAITARAVKNRAVRYAELFFALGFAFTSLAEFTELDGNCDSYFFLSSVVGA